MGWQTQEREMQRECQIDRSNPSCYLDGVDDFNPLHTEEVEVTDRETFCALCQWQCESEEELSRHNTQKSHKVNCLKAWLSVNKDKCEEDKFGVTINCPDVNVLRDNSFPIQTYVRSPKSISIIVENNGDHDVVIRNVDFLIDMQIATVHDDLGLNMENRGNGLGVTKENPYKRFAKLEPHSRYEFTLTCQSLQAGVYYIPLAFDFYIDGKNVTFAIIRHFTIQFTTSLIEQLESIPEHKKQPVRRIEKANITVIPGKPIPRDNTQLKPEISLHQHFPDETLRSIYKLRSWNELDTNKLGNISMPEITLLEDILDMFEDRLGPSNYSKYFKTLLHIEELQMESDITFYDVPDGKLEVFNQAQHFYKIKVAGLRENRPSILRGDKVYVQRIFPGDVRDDVMYEGIVHHVENITVTLGFDPSFSQVYVRNMPFFITFSFSRIPLRRMHQAIEFVRDHHRPILFPERCLNPYSRNAYFSDISPFNRVIQLNNEQKQVILQILNGGSRPAPYLLFGPPGTGKTMTLVEAIKQVWFLEDKSYILVCAPSNSACDTVTERLLDHVPSSIMLRLYASSRDKCKISDKIKKCSNFDGGEFFFPDKSELKKYRILITTLICSGRLVQAAFSTQHFTHIFIDEAGQSIEPESLIPITGLIDCRVNRGTLVLAGDPRQLGPVLRSKITAGSVPYIKDSLAISLLERLMKNCDLYQRREMNNGNAFDPRYLTKLVRNYRSHEAILALPNKLFYDGELIACADKIFVNSFCNWEHLPKKNFPIIFHGVMGREKKEKQSPSFYNPEEISVVINYVNTLLDERKVQPKDIGIISPYRKQVEKIKWSLERNGRTDITVGSTEEFQGQERRVIIISTVRSTSKVLTCDFEIKLGFLKNEKRFNVAVTRAKALLIVIGNPYMLIKDEQWGAFLSHCKEQKAYIGCQFSRSEDAAEDIFARFERLNIIPDGVDIEEDVIPISQVEMEESPQWPLVTE